jgi:hypothetical protein
MELEGSLSSSETAINLHPQADLTKWQQDNPFY